MESLEDCACVFPGIADFRAESGIALDRFDMARRFLGGATGVANSSHESACADGRSTVDFGVCFGLYEDSLSVDCEDSSFGLFDGCIPSFVGLFDEWCIPSSVGFFDGCIPAESDAREGVKIELLRARRTAERFKDSGVGPPLSLTDFDSENSFGGDDGLS